MWLIGLALCGRGLWRGHGLRLRIDYVGVAYGGAVPCDWAWIVWVWLIGGVAYVGVAHGEAWFTIGHGLWAWFTEGRGLWLGMDYVGVAPGGGVAYDWAWVVWAWLAEGTWPITGRGL